MDVASLNSIASVQVTIGSLRLQLEKKREELERLNQALSDLSDCQDDFHEKKHLCLEPELEKTTWYGALANDFDSLREGEVQTNYVGVYKEQIDDAIAAVEAKIEEVKQAIDSLETSITFQEATLANLRAKED